MLFLQHRYATQRARKTHAPVVVATGLGSTGLLTAFLKPYVVRMYMDNVPSLDVFLEQLQSGTDPQRVLAETKVRLIFQKLRSRVRDSHHLPFADHL